MWEQRLRRHCDSQFVSDQSQALPLTYLYVVLFLTNTKEPINNEPFQVCLSVVQNLYVFCDLGLFAL